MAPSKSFDFCWKVLLAMFILLFISFSDLPSSVIRAPRYVNVWTFSISFPSMCILVLGGLLLLENTIVFVFFAFISLYRYHLIQNVFRKKSQK